MGNLHRIDPPDTIDLAIRQLMGLQADGWTLDKSKAEFHTGRPSPTHRELLVGVTLTIELRPAQ